MAAPPAGLQAYQKREKHTQLKRSFQAHTPQVPDSALQRLRNKLDKGCIRYICPQCRSAELPRIGSIYFCLSELQQSYTAYCYSSTERHVLRMLETQTATQAQAAANAKAAIKRAAQAERDPLTSAQIEARCAWHNTLSLCLQHGGQHMSLTQDNGMVHDTYAPIFRLQKLLAALLRPLVHHRADLSESYVTCRFKSRARAAEVAAAKARTHYTPEGPNAEDQEANTQDAAPHNFKRQRTSKSRSNQEYWDCYFHRNQRSARARNPQPAHQTCSDIEEEEDFDQNSFSSCDEGSDSDGDCIDLDSNEEEQEEYAGQQHPQSFYKQPPCIMSVPSAFQQLVNFVRQLPLRVKDDRAAAHLKTFEARKVEFICWHTETLCGNAM